MTPLVRLDLGPLARTYLLQHHSTTFPFAHHLSVLSDSFPWTLCAALMTHCWLCLVAHLLIGCFFGPIIIVLPFS